MKVPDFSKEYSVDFSKLDGGLNLRDMGYLMEKNESPFVKNMMWRDGLLQSRWGQRKVAEVSYAFDSTRFHVNYAVCERPFHGYTFFHIGDTIQCLRTDTPLQEPSGSVFTRCNTLYSGVMTNRGTFFPYHGKLYYKNRGGFYEITYAPDGEQTGGTIRAHFDVYPRNDEAFGASTFSIFQKSGSYYVKINSWSGIPSSDAEALSEQYVIREDATGMLLSAETLPAVSSADYAKCHPGVDDQERIAAADVWPGAVLRISRPNDNSNKVLLYYLPAGEDKKLIGVRFGNSKLRYIEDGDLYSRWLLRTSSGDSSPFRLVNLGYYRAEAGEYQIYFRPQASIDPAPFSVANLADVADDPANAPVIVINADPEFGSGTMYQPENRLSYNKTVWYNAVAGRTMYKLPVREISAVLRVEVGNEVLTEYTGETPVPAGKYKVYKSSGTVQFGTAPDPGNPQTNNTVRITYRKANTDVRYAVIDCPYAAVVSGGDSMQYIVVGGCEQRPDAIFWNANDELAVEPWYFPIPCYNLVGTAGDPVTGFGKQYDDTLVFSDYSVGKLAYSVQSVDGRDYPAFGYVRVNDRIGCDLPWTIRQIENNAVFCNSYTGAHIVLSSSAAYENNIQCISDKINNLSNDEDTGSGMENVGPGGLLADIRNCTVDVLSFDDDSRYWLIISGKVYVWDYDISTYAKPSWFFWNRIPSRGVFFDVQHNVYHVDRYESILAFRVSNNDFYDYHDGTSRVTGYRAISKVYRFPTQLLGGFTHLKNITQLLIALREDTPSTVSAYYYAEHEARGDLVDMVTTVSSTLPPVTRRFVKVFRRTPGCRNIRQFSLTLSNNIINEDLAPVSVQIFYRYSGKERGAV